MKNKGSLIFTMIMTLLVIGVIAALIISNQNKKESSVDTESLGTANTNNQQGLKLLDQIDIKDQPMIGKDEAKVTIIEFGDFKCPACKVFELDIKPDLKKKYIASGKAKLYFINTPFHGEGSMLGSLAAETLIKQEPDKYSAFQQALFEMQPDTEEEWLTIDAVKKAAKTAAVSNIDKLVKDVEALKEKAAVKKDINLVEKHNVTMTPTIIVNGKEVKNPMDPAEVDKVIDEAVKQ